MALYKLFITVLIALYSFESGAYLSLSAIYAFISLSSSARVFLYSFSLLNACFAVAFKLLSAPIMLSPIELAALYTLLNNPPPLLASVGVAGCSIFLALFMAVSNTDGPFLKGLYALNSSAPPFHFCGPYVFCFLGVGKNAF